MTFIEQLRSVLRKSPRSPQEIGAATGIEPAGIEQLRSGERPSLPIDQVSALTEYLGLRPAPGKVSRWLPVVVSILALLFTGVSFLLSYSASRSDVKRSLREDFRRQLAVVSDLMELGTPTLLNDDAAKTSTDGAKPFTDDDYRLIDPPGRAELAFQSARAMEAELQGQLSFTDYQVLGQAAFLFIGHRESDRFLQKGLEAAKAQNDVIGQISMHAMLGQMLFASSHLEPGRNEFENALALIEKTPETEANVSFVRGIHQAIAIAEMRYGDTARAKDAFNEADRLSYRRDGYKQWRALMDKSMRRAEKLRTGDEPRAIADATALSDGKTKSVATDITTPVGSPKKQ